MNQGASPYDRPAAGFAGQPQPSTQEQTYVDGFRPGDFKYSYGVLDLVLKVNPGWYLADGTVTLQDGTTPPDMRGRFIIGADGTTFPLGGTGGTASHVHPFTHEAAHGITQPVFAAPAAHAITQPVFASHGAHQHDNNHSVTQPTAHGITQPAFQNHNLGVAGGPIEVTATPGSGLFIWVFTTAANATAATAHNITTNVALTNNHAGTAVAAHSDHDHTNNHTISTQVALTNNHAAPARTTDVALTNNAPHAGGSVDAAVGDNKYPPYAALWPLVKKF